MKRIIFTLIAGTALMVGQVSADMIETTVGAAMVPVPMVPGVTYSVTGTHTSVASPVNAPAGSVHAWTPGDRYLGGTPGTTFSKTIMFSTPIPISYVAARFQDLDVSAAGPALTVTVAGGTATTGDLASAGTSGLAFAGGVFTAAGAAPNTFDEVLGTSAATITSMTLTSNQNDAMFYAFGFNKTAIMAAVPEPSSLMFLGLVVTGLGIRRRYSK